MDIVVVYQMRARDSIGSVGVPSRAEQPIACDIAYADSKQNLLCLRGEKVVAEFQTGVWLYWHERQP